MIDWLAPWQWFAAYAQAALLVGALAYLDLRRDAHDRTSNVLLSFALGVFWPFTVTFAALVCALILLRDRENGAP